MQLLQHFKELTVRPKNAKELKGLVLQLAIQGKLTANWRKNNPNIEPASELLNRIKKEKERLVKDKKIRKEKLLPVIEKHEIPFKSPSKWGWYRLRDVGLTMTGGTPSKSNSNFFGDDVPFLKPGDIKDWKVNYENEGLSLLGQEKLGRTAISGSVLMVCLGTIGKCAIINRDCSFNQQINAITPLLISSNYLLNCLSSKYFYDVAWEKSTSTTIALLNKGKWESIPIPIPPLEEQKEIVKVVETLFKEIEQLEQLTVKRISLKEDFVTSALNQLTTNNANQEWTFLQDHFKSFFNETSNIKKLRETVLQLAVQGKLTADWRVNNTDTENASILLKRIQKEKAQLIKDKKIKKEKALPKITKEEIPYELPEGWVWEYLGNSMLKITDGTHHSPANVENGDFKYVSAKNIKSKGVKLSNITYVTEEAHKEIYARCNPELGDLLYIKDGATTGICCINDLDEEFSMLSSVALIKQPKEVLNEYLLRVFRSPYYYDLMRKGMTGVAITRVTLTKLKASIIPIPPLEEQKAIVEKVNALMGLCNRLEQNVEQNQEYSAQLMQSCLREVFEK
tara:strand:+ start:7070 stop:8770 length:1701 start_codon:yes stop_codon:yes gene_type:complete